MCTKAARTCPRQGLAYAVLSKEILLEFFLDRSVLLLDRFLLFLIHLKSQTSLKQSSTTHDAPTIYVRDNCTLEQLWSCQCTSMPYTGPAFELEKMQYEVGTHGYPSAPGAGMHVTCKARVCRAARRRVKLSIPQLLKRHT